MNPSVTTAQRFRAQCANGKQVCLGLDTDIDRIPAWLRASCDVDEPELHPLYVYGKAIVNATLDVVGCYKLNSAFYEAAGWRGVRAMEWLVAHIRGVAPDIPIIGDVKRGDIGSTNNQYGKAHFDVTRFDAITVSPYPGFEGALDALINGWPDKLFFVLCRTSNKGAVEFQDMMGANGKSWWRNVALTVGEHWNTHGNCGLVVGATYPTELGWVRSWSQSMPILSPGIGTQGGDLAAAVAAGGAYTTYNNSSGIIYKSTGRNYAEAAAEAALSMHTSIRAAQQL